MKLKHNIVLAIFFMALLTYYFYEKSRIEKREAAKERERKVFVIEKDSINSIVLKPSNIHIQKSDDTWEITKPIKYQTEKYVVNNILSSLENAKKERTIVEEPTDYGIYGFSDSSLQIIFEYSGKNDTLFLGDKNPTGSFVFARKSGSPEIFLATTSLLYNAKKSLFDIRDKTILQFNTPDVNKVKFKIGKNTFVLSKDKDDWKLEQPIQSKGDKSTMNRILGKIKTSRVKEFVDENPAKLSPYGLSKPKITVDVFLGENNAKKTLLLGKEKDNKYFAKDESRTPVFLVDSTLFNTLNNIKLFDLRNKTINEFTVSQITQVEFEYPDIKIVCQKDSAGDWQIISPEKRKGRRSKIIRILNDLKEMKAKEFVYRKPKSFDEFGLKNPRGKISVKEGDQLFAGVLIGKEIKDKAYIQNLLKEEVYLVKKADANKLIVSLNDLAEVEAESKTNENEKDKE